MKAPEFPAEEAERLQALDASQLVCTPAEQRFDLITESARKLLDVPIALFSLVTADKQWFKSGQGLSVPETSRTISFCGHCILTPELFIVPDTLRDSRFADNPLVTGEPKIRFYAGCRIVGVNELAFGTLCVLDTRPRHLDIFQRQQLRGLGQWLTYEVRNRGLSEQELELLARRESSDSRLIDPLTKCWNRQAGEFLLAHTMDTAHPEEDVAAVILDFRPTGDAWESLPVEQVSAASAGLGNLLRVTVPDCGRIFTMDVGLFVVFFKTGDDGASIETARELIRDIPELPSGPVPLVHRALLLHSLGHAGRYKLDIVSELERSVAQVAEGELEIRHWNAREAADMAPDN